MTRTLTFSFQPTPSDINNTKQAREKAKEFLFFFSLKRMEGQQQEKSPTLCSQVKSLSNMHHMFVYRTWKTPTYCNVCEGLLWGLSKQGKECVCCRYVTHTGECEKKASAQPLCRRSSRRAHEPASSCCDHHWVRGNLKGIQKCSVCNTIIAISQATLGRHYRCSGCALKCHEDCMAQAPKTCDGGPLGPSILQGNEVIEKEDGSFELAMDATSVKKRAPLVVFINSRSGANQGAQVLANMLSYLNRHQVWDLADGGPSKGLLFFSSFPDARVVACGGDGTFGWISSAIDAMQPPMEQKRFAVGHFPLGTGNDMSRSQGWGPGYAGQAIKNVLQAYQDADVTTLDRWRITFDGHAHGYTPAMNNYFGVGVDAQVAHRFHTERESNPDKFTNRTMNKIKYVSWGLTATLKGLAQNVKLICDDKEISLPASCQAVAVLNLPNYAAGQKLWDDSEHETFGKNAFGDGWMEVISLKGASDVGLAAVGIKPQRLAQCKKLQMILSNETLPVQMDGEPWMQDPCTVEITLLNQVPVLINSSKVGLLFEEQEMTEKTNGNNNNNTNTMLEDSTWGGAFDL